MAIFSKRFRRALADKSLGLSLPYRLRKRIWLTLVKYDRSYYYQPDPDDSWTERTTVLAELPAALKPEYGEDELLGYTDVGTERVPVTLEGLVLGGWPGQVLDTIELFVREVDDDKRADFQREVNRIFLEEGVPWRLADGEFFRVDSEFLAIEVQRTEELLHAQGFTGVLAELREARNDLSSGDYRGGSAARVTRSRAL